MNIPTEIYLGIFQHLNKKELAKCIRVCKEWSFPAIQVYYKYLYITRTRIPKIRSLIEEEQYFKNFCHVKVLTIYQNSTEDDTQVLTKKECIKLFSYMSDLRKIEIRPNRGSLNYFLCLLEVSLPHLEQIEIKDLRLTESTRLHHSIYQHFCTSLTHLSVIDQPKSMISSGFVGVLNYLRSFKNLTHLSYYDNTGNPLTIYQLQEACPSLINIDCRSNDKVPKVPAVNNDSFYSFNNLKKLSLYFPSLPTNYVKNITKYLPTSVEKITVNMNNVYLYDWIDEIGIDTALQFFERLSILNHVKIKWNMKNEGRVIENRYTSTMTTFFKLLYTFVRGRKIFCSAHFDTVYCGSNSISFHDGKLRIVYGLKHDDFYGDNRSLESHILNFAVPSKFISVIGLEIVKQLVFDIHNLGDISYEVLDYLLVNCPNLQYVKFNDLDNGKDFKISKTAGIECIISVDNLDTSTTSKENLKVFQSWDFIPSQDFFDLLSSNLPNINIITCLEPDYHYIENNIHSAPSKVDLSKFENLEIFYLDIQLLFWGDNKSLFFLQFNYIDGEDCYYKYVKEENAKLEPISREIFQNNARSSFPGITFRCRKNMQFSIRVSEYHEIIDILEGCPQVPRPEKCDDTSFLDS